MDDYVNAYEELSDDARKHIPWRYKEIFN
jgi:hypothetical protein